MKLVKLLVVVAFAALFIVACGDSTSTNQPSNTTAGTSPSPVASPKATASATPADELADAKQTFSKVCAACHQETGEGGSVKIENKMLKVPSLKEGHALKHTDEEFAKQISKGGDGMPPFKDKLSPEQINNLVKFIRRDIQGNAAPNANAAK